MFGNEKWKLGCKNSGSGCKNSSVGCDYGNLGCINQHLSCNSKIMGTIRRTNSIYYPNWSLLMVDNTSLEEDVPKWKKMKRKGAVFQRVRDEIGARIQQFENAGQ